MIGDTSSELVEHFGASAFEAVHNSDLDGLVYFGADGTIEYVNRAAMRIFGVDEKIVGRNIFELHDTEYDDLLVELIFPSDHIDLAREAYHEGRPTRSEMIVIEEDERREIEVMWGPVQREDEIVGIVGSYRDVSSRPDIHDQLTFELAQIEKERRFFASIIEQLNEGLFVFDEHMELHLANSSALELLELKAPIEGLPIRECLEDSALADPDRLLDQLERSRRNETSTVDLYRLDSADGGLRRLEIAVSPAGVGDTRFICTLSDTTCRVDLRHMKLLDELAQATIECGASDLLYDRIVESIDAHLDADFTVLTTHDGDALCPVAWRGLLIEDDMCLSLSSYEPLRDALESGSVRSAEAWAWREEGADGTGEQLIIPIRARGEKLGTLHLGFIETSEGRDDEAATETPDVAFLEAIGSYVTAALYDFERWDRSGSDRERLEAILESLPIGILLYDRRGEVLFVNASAIRITGYSEWSNLNTDSPPYRILDGEEGEPLSRAEWPFFEAVQREACCQAEVFFDFETHRRDVSLRAAPVAGEAETPELFVGILEDRTERRRYDRRKDEFLSIASHELRSPLTPLTGVLQLARRQRERGDDVDLSLLIRAERQVARLTRLIDGLLDLTRIETGRIELDRERVELGSFVERSAKPWEYNPKDIDVEISGPGEPIEVMLDPDRLQQVITNLIDNAVKYSQTNGAICIDVDACNDRAVLGIEDDGVGMDEETVARVFDRFFHGRDDDRGPRSMGLGLYICRQIVEQHGGSIHIDSTKGQGTRIDIMLPLDAETSLSATPDIARSTD